MGKFNPSYTGLGELLSSPEMVVGMKHFAEKIKERAEVMSPVGDEHDPHRGDYKAGWSVESGVREAPSRRAFARVHNDVDYAAAIEFGNGRRAGRRSFNVPNYTLTRAIDAARE